MAMVVLAAAGTDRHAVPYLSRPREKSRHFVDNPFGLLIRDGSGIPARLSDNNFDALRLVFASMVVVFHEGILSHEPSLVWCLHVSATFAVEAFFVVSGFLVTMSYERSSSMGAYASKRLRRILPAYVTVITAAALTLAGLSTLPWKSYFTSPAFWRYLGFNLVLSNFSAPNLPGVFGSNYITAVNGSLWTIKIEVAFYCLVPFIVWTTRRFGFRKVLGALFVTSVLWKVGFNSAAEATGAEIYAKIAKQLPGQLCFFAGGAWAYYNTREGRGISGLAATLGLVVYAFCDGGWYCELSTPLAVTVVVYWAAIAGPRLPSVAAHGDFSYGVYLYHFPLVQAFVALGVFHRSPLAGLTATMSAVAVCAAGSWYLVESPALRQLSSRNHTSVP